MKRMLAAVGLGLALSMTAACGSAQSSEPAVEVEDCDYEDFQNGEPECEGYTEEDFEEASEEEPVEEEDDKDKKKGKKGSKGKRR